MRGRGGGQGGALLFGTLLAVLTRPHAMCAGLEWLVSIGIVIKINKRAACCRCLKGLFLLAIVTNSMG